MTWKTATHRDRGQLAVGLAFSLLTIIAMFALVFQSSLLTREKMKVQQNIDLAALVGAEVQRANLNYIQEANTQIETLYRSFQTAVTPIPCMYFFPTGGSLTAMNAVAVAVSGKGGECTTVCEQIDEGIRGRYRDAYTIAVNKIQEKILVSIRDANAIAQVANNRVILNQDTLPHRLKRLVKQKFGGNATAASLADAYDHGAFEGDIQILAPMEGKPLFNPKIEMRAFPYFNSKSAYAPVSGDVERCSTPIPNAKPNLMTVTAKVGRVGKANAWFFSGAFMTFDQMLSPVERNYGLGFKDPFSDSNENLSSGAGVTEDVHLFTSHTLMMAIAMAKPYGGEYPIAAGLDHLTGSAGRKFQGVKLIGFADDEEQGVNELRGIKLGLGNDGTGALYEFDLGAEVLH